MSLDAEDGPAELAHRPRRGAQLGDAFHLAEPSAHRDRDRRPAARSFLRSRPASCSGSSPGRLTDVSIPTPVAAHGMVYVSSGYLGNEHRPVYAIKPGASGDITVKFGEEPSEFVAWYQPRAGSATTPRQSYTATTTTRCLTVASSRATTRGPARRFTRANASSLARPSPPSPWAYQGKLFLLSEDGNTYVIQPGPEFKLLGKNTLDEMTLASPAIAGSRLLIRTASNLYAFKK